MTVVERDRDLAAFLREEFAEEVDEGRLTVIEGDALSVELPEFTASVSNLPYGVSSEITFRLLPEKRPLVLMYQQEFAERMVAELAPRPTAGCRCRPSTTRTSKSSSRSRRKRFRRRRPSRAPSFGQCLVSRPTRSPTRSSPVRQGAVYPAPEDDPQRDPEYGPHLRTRGTGGGRRGGRRGRASKARRRDVADGVRGACGSRTRGW